MGKLQERLLEEFPSLRREDWELKLHGECQKLDNEKNLYWKTAEDITVNPYYCSKDIESMSHLDASAALSFIRKSKRGRNTWEIRQDIIVHDIAAANQKALHMLEGGTDAIGFDLREAGNLNYNEYSALLENIDLRHVPLHWTGVENPDHLIDHLQKLTEKLKPEKIVIRGSACSDPLGDLTKRGSFRKSYEKDMGDAGGLILKAVRSLPGLRVVEINAQHFINAGGSSVHELGFGLAIAAEYFSWFTDMGIPAEKIAAHIQLNLGTGSNYFFEIAKLRAARMLFAGLIRTFDKTIEDNKSVYIQSITSNWNKTVYGSHVNMLRLTTESMAAILGGCDSLLVKPYDECFREGGHLSERLARNLQIILREESYFDKVTDVASGSYYIESITKSLCEKAWNLFLETEAKGGYFKSFRSGYIQKEIKEKVNKRIKRTACGKEIFLGTNAYPDFDEKVSGEISRDKLLHRMPVVSDQIAEPIAVTRASVEFERIRLAIEKNPGKRPEVFILAYGNQAGRLARSQFSSNYFATAGYEVIENMNFEKIEDGVAEALQRKADIIVACSSDKEYAGTVPQIHDLTRGKVLLVVAGAPSCMEELKEYGIQHFIYAGSDMIETFKHLNNKLGIY